METRNIFIDSCIFIRENYHFRGQNFGHLILLAKSHQAKVFVTDITVREVEAHIETDISNAIQASKKFQRDARVLRNMNGSPFEEFFQEICEAESSKILKRQFSTFLDQVLATELDTSEASIKKVFEKYFLKESPFGDGKNKNEFPDAFAIVTIETWCKTNSERIYVVTTDSGMIEYCETSDCLIPLTKLPEFFNIIASHNKATGFLRQLLCDNRRKIEEAIAECFCEQGFWIDDQEGDVEDVRVDDLTWSNMLVLELNPDTAVVHVDVKTNFSADLTYDDMETAVYDSEDKVLIPLSTIHKTINQDVDYPATIHVSHNLYNSGSFEVDLIEIKAEQDFGFPVKSNDEDEWPYK